MIQALVFALALLPHGGGLDSLGCHYDRKQGRLPLSPGTPRRPILRFQGRSPGSSAEAQAPNQSTALKGPWRTVTRVVDGDTIILNGRERVRLIGVDTPETVDPRRPVQYFGKEASGFTKRMVEGKKVRLEYDQTGKDRYGRTLAYVYLEDGTTGKILRNEIIAEVRNVPTRSQAQALLDEKLRSLNQGNHKPQAVATFEEFVRDQWISKMIPTFKRSTSEIYKILLHAHVLPYFGSMRLCDLRPADVQAFVTEKTEAGFSPNTIRNLRNLTSRILRTAQEWGFLETNAARGVRLPPKRLSRPPKVLTVGQARALLNELKEPARTMVLICILTGLRAGELFALRWRHVDFGERILRIRDAVHRGFFQPRKLQIQFGTFLSVKCCWLHSKHTASDKEGAARTTSCSQLKKGRPSAGIIFFAESSTPLVIGQKFLGWGGIL